MAEVRLIINGRPYDVACDDGQEAHVMALGKTLGDQVGQLVGKAGQIGDARLLLMAALIQADEAARLRETVAALREEASKQAEAIATMPASTDLSENDAANSIDRLARQVEMLAARLEQA